jgi:hypothetical protein
MATLGAGVMEDPATVVVGWATKANLAAAPGVMLKVELVAKVKVPEVAPSV